MVPPDVKASSTTPARSTVPLAVTVEDTSPRVAVTVR
jgi:hypothetical protein